MHGPTDWGSDTAITPLFPHPFPGLILASIPLPDGYALKCKDIQIQDEIRRQALQCALTDHPSHLFTADAGDGVRTFWSCPSDKVEYEDALATWEQNVLPWLNDYSFTKSGRQHT